MCVFRQGQGCAATLYVKWPWISDSPSSTSGLLGLQLLHYTLFLMLEVQSRTSYILGKHSPTALDPQPELTVYNRVLKELLPQCLRYRIPPYEPLVKVPESRKTIQGIAFVLTTFVTRQQDSVAEDTIRCGCRTQRNQSWTDTATYVVLDLIKFWL